MPAGYIKIDKDQNVVLREVIEKFKHLEYNELIDEDNEKKGRLRMRCVFLYATTGQRKINYSKISRNTAKVRSQEVSNFDRFVVLGVEGTAHVVLIFTKTNEESMRLLTYKNLTPGCCVFLLCPRVLGFLKGTQNPLCYTGDPLVPCPRRNIYKVPPADVNLCSYVFFDFIATNFKLIQAVPRDKACRGKLCDSQCITSSCPCLVADTRTHWVLDIHFTCDELCENVTDEDSVKFSSMSFTKMMVHSSKTSHQLNNDNIDTYDMEDSVQQLCEAVDKKQKFRIIGWFKPAQNEDGTAASSGNFSYHVSSLFPALDLTDYQKSLMYGADNNIDIENMLTTGRFNMASSSRPMNLNNTTSASSSELNNVEQTNEVNVDRQSLNNSNVASENNSAPQNNSAPPNNVAPQNNPDA